MKKVLYLLPLLCVLGLNCKKLTQLLTFDIANSQDIKIPATPVLAVPIVSPVPVTVNSQESFENNKTKASLVKNVVLKKLTLTIKDPATENFNFLKSIRLFIGTDDSDKILLAYLDNIPMNVAVIDLTSSNSKLDKYIKASGYTLYTEVSIRSGISKELTVRADSKFQVTADPL